MDWFTFTLIFNTFKYVTLNAAWLAITAIIKLDENPAILCLIKALIHSIDSSSHILQFGTGSEEYLNLGQIEPKENVC